MQPIIHQDVARISHRRSVQEMIRNGRDLEKLVLAPLLAASRKIVFWSLETRQSSSIEPLGHP